MQIRKGSCPDWSEVFRNRPDLEAPGYQEAVRNVIEQKRRAETEKIKAQMQEIQKDKISYKNKTRNKRRTTG